MITTSPGARSSSHATSSPLSPRVAARRGDDQPGSVRAPRPSASRRAWRTLRPRTMRPSTRHADRRPPAARSPRHRERPALAMRARPGRRARAGIGTRGQKRRNDRGLLGPGQPQRRLQGALGQLAPHRTGTGSSRATAQGFVRTAAVVHHGSGDAPAPRMRATRRPERTIPRRSSWPVHLHASCGPRPPAGPRPGRRAQAAATVSGSRESWLASRARGPVCPIRTYVVPRWWATPRDHVGDVVALARQDVRAEQRAEPPQGVQLLEPHPGWG